MGIQSAPRDGRIWVPAYPTVLVNNGSVSTDGSGQSTTSTNRAFLPAWLRMLPAVYIKSCMFKDTQSSYISPNATSCNSLLPTSILCVVGIRVRCHGASLVWKVSVSLNGCETRISVEAPLLEGIICYLYVWESCLRHKAFREFPLYLIIDPLAPCATSAPISFGWTRREPSPSWLLHPPGQIISNSTP